MRPDSLSNEVVTGFFEHRIVEVNLETPFVLASGRTAPVYIDHRRIFSVPDLRRKVARLWADRVRSALSSHPQAGRIDASLVVAGTATAGIAPAYALAEELNCRFVYVRSKAKEHGTGQLVEGVWEPGSRVIVVDDMVTTGGSILEAARKLRDAKGTLLFASSITRHDFASTLERFKAERLELASVFKTTDVFDTAYRMNVIGSKEMRAVMAWLAQWQS